MYTYFFIHMCFSLYNTLLRVNSSAIDNIFVDKSRMQLYETFPLSNALSDHEAQYIILNKFFPETKVKNSKHKNNCRVRIIVSETVSYFQDELLQESWENVFFPTEEVNSSFNKFLNTFLIIFEASFPYTCLSNDEDKGWITHGIRKPCQRKRSLYIISKNSDNLMTKLYYKSYCSILKTVIREGKKYILNT